MSDAQNETGEWRQTLSTRRGFMKTAGVAGIAATLSPLHAAAQVATEPAAPMTKAGSGGMAVAIALRINGQPRTAKIDPRTSVLDLLREELNLPGTKKGCNQGACGACTVLVDGERINSCLALAVQYDGRSITTIEGVGTADDAHPLQQAFIECDGFQCGYCTPGQICSAIGMANEFERGVPSALTKDLAAQQFDLSDDEIRERMSGNLCRCGAYNGIVDAVRQTYAKNTTGKVTP